MIVIDELLKFEEEGFYVILNVCVVKLMMDWEGIRWFVVEMFGFVMVGYEFVNIYDEFV